MRNRLGMLLLTLCLAACATLPPLFRRAPAQTNGITVILTDRFKAQLDSVTAESVRTNSEQMACVERYTIKEDDGGKIITLSRLGPSPLAWISDEASVTAPVGFSHLCYFGQPPLHTHPPGYFTPSPLDFQTTFEHEGVPFAMILTTGWDLKSWTLKLYAVRP